MSEPAATNKTASGIAFLVLGLVFLVPSGLCTGVFGGGALLEMLAHPENGNDAWSILAMALIFGGPFIAVGYLLVRVGIRNLRGPK
jgi:hypothetical protein